MKFTKIPDDTFQNMQLNAGILVEDFNIETGEFDKLVGATKGGITFNAAPTYSDFGDDIDNCPKNMKELKKLDSVEATLSGTLLTVTPKLAKSLIAAADIDEEDATHIVPRKDILESDFKDIWWLGDYSGLNGEKNGGYCAIHLFDALNTGGFQIKTSDKAKGEFAFTYMAHFSMADQDKIPYEVYIKLGEAEPTEEPLP
ncbi:MAG: hypothetical protein KBS54_00795 [Synergistaceae bacterium]|nr:hypothetical protein [Candidatus Equadaptatus faecalis]